MKKESTRISANEMNRFMYCKSQWYYKRIYGVRVLNEMYKELGIESSNHESNFEKGMRHHKQYHFKYRVLRLLRLGVLLVIIGLAIKVVGQWIQ